jgi:hypothetical protein
MTSLNKEQLFKLLKAVTGFSEFLGYFLVVPNSVTELDSLGDKFILESHYDGNLISPIVKNFKSDGARYDGSYLYIFDEWDIEYKLNSLFAVDVEAFID